MTKKVALFVENGSEELELIAPLDIMRRSGLEVDLISANDNKSIISAHGVNIVADKTINEIDDILIYDAIVIPGGMPGSEHLKNNAKIIKFYQNMYNENKLVAAICAAPIVLNEAGLTADKNVTCYPGFEKQIDFKNFDKNKAVVIDGNMITAQGPAVAFLFGLEIVEYLLGKEKRDEVANPMLINVLKENI